MVLLAGEKYTKTQELLAVVGANEEDDEDEVIIGDSDRVITDRDMKRCMSGFRFAMNSEGEVILVDQNQPDDLRANGHNVDTASGQRSVKSSWIRYWPCCLPFLSSGHTCRSTQERSQVACIMFLILGLPGTLLRCETWMRERDAGKSKTYLGRFTLLGR